jgi:hypothetical protein
MVKDVGGGAVVKVEEAVAIGITSFAAIQFDKNWGGASGEGTGGA